MGNLPSAIRHARKGPLRRETIEDAPEQFLYPPCPKFGVRSLDWRLHLQVRMPRIQEPLGILLVVPDVIGGGNHARKPLGFFALLKLQVAFSTFIRCRRDDPIYSLPLFFRIVDHARHAVAESGFWESMLHYFLQIPQRVNLRSYSEYIGDRRSTDHLDPPSPTNRVSLDIKISIIWLRSQQNLVKTLTDRPPLFGSTGRGDFHLLISL